MISKQLLKKNQRIILILILFALLRVPSLWEPHWHSDEGIYASVAYGMQNGLTLYEDVYDHKPPLIFVIYYVAGLLPFFDVLWIAKLISLVAGAFAVAGFYRLTRLVFTRYSVFATLVFCILLGTPIFEGNVANAEVLFLPLIVWAYVLAFNEKQKWYIFFLSGLLLGVALLLKVHPVFDTGAILFLLLTLKRAESVTLKIRMSAVILVLAGIVVPLSVAILVIIATGVWEPFYQAVVVDSFLYSEVGNAGRISSIVGYMFLFGITLVSGFLYRVNKIPSMVFMILVILLFEMIAVFISGRAYGHYLVQVILGLSLIAGFMVQKYRERSEQYFKLTMSMFAFTICVGLVFWIKLFITTDPSHYRYLSDPIYTLRYYGNYILYAGGFRSQETYMQFFNNEPLLTSRLHTSLDTQSCEAWLVLSDNGWLYGDLSIVPHFPLMVGYQLHYKGFERFREDLVRDLKDSRFCGVVWDTRVWLPDEVRDALIEGKNYHVALRQEVFEVYVSQKD